MRRLSHPENVALGPSPVAVTFGGGASAQTGGNANAAGSAGAASSGTPEREQLGCGLELGAGTLAVLAEFDLPL